MIKINDKYIRDIRKLDKYQHGQWSKNNENYFSKTKELLIIIE